jgi:hypothetical protein
VLIATLVGAVVITVAPRIEEAREVARRSQCKNYLFSHSGSHCSIIYFDRNLEPVRVWSCPLCSSLGAPSRFAFLTDDDRREAALRGRIPSNSAAFRAAQMLNSVNNSPEFSRFRDRSTAVGRLWDENGDVIHSRSGGL